MTEPKLNTLGESMGFGFRWILLAFFNSVKKSTSLVPLESNYFETLL